MWYRSDNMPLDEFDWGSLGGLTPLQDPPTYPESSEGQDDSTKARTGCGDGEAKTGDGCSSSGDGGARRGEALPSYSGTKADNQSKV
jgi:hypothetical protein